MKKFLLYSTLPLLLPAVAAAQAKPKMEVFGGFSLAASEFSFHGGETNGWNASLNVKRSPRLGFVSDFAGYYKTISYGHCCPSDHSTTYTFLFGPQISTSFSRFTPFAQALVGVGHIHYVADAGAPFDPIKKHTSIAYALGGGLDVRVAHRMAWRFQGDYLYTAFQTYDNQLTSTRENARFSTGLVWRF
ncbi:MAG: outer membrane protein [Candidatus Acidiferrales bacterium]